MLVSSRHFGLGALILVMALFCGQFAQADSPSLKTSQTCEALLSASIKPGELNQTQVQRLSSLLSQMTPIQRQTLYKSLSGENLADLIRRYRRDNLADSDRAILASHPGLDVVLQDLSDFNDSFPGIFGLENADETILRVLKAVRQQELHGAMSAPDLLQAQSTAPRLRRTIDNTLINLIEQGEMEYRGLRSGRSGFANFLYKIGRFFAPTYSKVRDTIEYSEVYSRQLTRLRLVDALIIRKALSEAVGLGFTDEEVQKLSMQVLNSPQEISDIEKELAQLFGPDFKIGRPVEIGHFNIPESAKRARMMDTDGVNESFDTMNLLGLDTLAKALDAARVRKSLKPRELSEFDLLELQLRHESYVRRLPLYKSYYREVTDHSSNVSYSVERRHTREVDSGRKDKDGNTIYETETYYVTESVNPTFENILADSYDEGDRMVVGLSEVRHAAQGMVEREGAGRSLISGIHELVDEILSNYSEAVMHGKHRDEYVKRIAEAIEKLNSASANQLAYSQWTDQQILAQYAQDHVANFRERNDKMFKRLSNAKAALVNLGELLRRNALEIVPAYDLFDYSGWLANLKRRRDLNYALKGGVAVATAAGAMAYGQVPEFQFWVNDLSTHFLALLQQLGVAR